MPLLRGNKRAEVSAVAGAVRGYTVTTSGTGGQWIQPNRVNVTAEACVRLLAQTVSDLPVCVVDVDNKRQAEPVWLREPMPGWSWDIAAWTEAFVESLLVDGNAYVVPARNRSGMVEQVWLIPPEAVTVQLSDDGKDIEYWLASYGKWRRELLHVRYLTRTGQVTGSGPVHWALRESTTGAYVGDLAQRLVRDGLHQTGFYKAMGTMTESQLADLRAVIQQHHGGLQNAHQQLVLSGDVSYQPTAVSPRDAELDGLSRWTAQEICRAFSVPPSLIGVAESGSVPYRNSHEILGHFHLFAVQPLIKRAERVWNSLLPPRLRCRYDERPLIRGTPQSRARILGSMSKVPGTFTKDELREVMGLEPLPNGEGSVLVGEQPAADTPEVESMDKALAELLSTNGEIDYGAYDSN